MTSPADGQGIPVVELRVYGMSGPPPGEVLAGRPAESVGGDDVAEVLRAEPGRVGERQRAVEALRWRPGMFGGCTRAMWLLLIPFALLNVSRYALTRPSAGSERVLRLLGLALTSTLVTNVTYVSLELVVRQCAAVEGCRDANGWLGFVDDWPFGAMLVLGGVPSGVMIGLLWWFGRRTFLYPPPGTGRGTPSPASGIGDHEFWRISTETSSLRDAHVAIACLSTGWLYISTLRTPEVSRPSGCLMWCSAVVGFILLAYTLYLVCSGRAASGRRLKWASLAYLVFGASLAAGFLSKGPQERPEVVPPLAGFEVLWSVHLPLVIALLGWLLWHCWRASTHVDDDEPTPDHNVFRPSWGGRGAFIVAAAATILAVGLSAALAYGVADLLAEPVLDGGAPGDRIELGVGYLAAPLWGVLGIALLVSAPLLVAVMARQPPFTIALLVIATLSAVIAVVLSWTALPSVYFWAAVVTAIVSYVVGAFAFTLAWSRDGVHDLVEVDYDLEAGAESTTARKIALRWRLAMLKYGFGRAVGALIYFGSALLSCAVLIAVACLISQDIRTVLLDSAPIANLAEIGRWSLTGLVGVMLLVAIPAWRGRKARTAVGVLWDLIGFWPRAAHPICPPPYGGRAVIETAARVGRLMHSGRPPVVVLSGHGQGSTVCAAAVLLLRNESGANETGRYLAKEDAEKALKHLGIVSCGSQLQWAHARLFHHYLRRKKLEQVLDVLNGSWRNVYRWTDSVGGPVLSWPPDRTPAPESDNDVRMWKTLGTDTTHGRVGAAGRRGVRHGLDIRVRDPESVSPVPGTPSSPLRGHQDYCNDPVFESVVTDVAKEIAVRVVRAAEAAARAENERRRGLRRAGLDRSRLRRS